MRRARTRLVVAAIAVALMWLGLVLPHLLDAWAQVLAFVAIVAAAAWGWGKVAKAKAPSASSTGTEAPAAVVDAPERKLADR